MDILISKHSIDSTPGPIVNVDATGQIKINKKAATIMGLSLDTEHLYFLSLDSEMYMVPSVSHTDSAFAFKKQPKRSDTYTCNSADLVRFITRVISISPYRVDLPQNADLYLSLLPYSYKGKSAYMLSPYSPQKTIELCSTTTQRTQDKVATYVVLGTEYTISTLRSHLKTYAKRSVTSTNPSARQRNKTKFRKMLQQIKDHGIYEHFTDITINNI